MGLMADEIKEILNHLIASPREDQIQLDFSIEKKIFILSVPIYRSRGSLSDAVRNYVLARSGKVFKPHSTSFTIIGSPFAQRSIDQETVCLVQEIPFSWGFRPSTRQDLSEFLQLARRCHRMLYEIALEEMIQDASIHLY